MGIFGMMSRAATGGDGGRSSTAGHLSQDYETAGVGTVAHEFYGIPLEFQWEDHSWETLTCLSLLILISIGKPKFLDGFGVSLFFWMVVVGVCHLALEEVTLYPLVANIIWTRTSYPYLVVIPHCIVAAAAYRKERTPTLHYMVSFGMGFFCYGFGGSIVSDLLMGLPVTALGHARIIPCYILGWCLVWCSPHDIVYRLLNDKSSVVHYFISACEAVDAVTTPMGRISRSARELQNKTTAPIAAGLLAGVGGAAIRYTERVVLQGGDEQVAQSSRDALEAGVWRTLGYSLLWWYIAVYGCTTDQYLHTENFADYHCHEYNGNNLHRFIIVLAHVIWNSGCDFGLVSGHPFVTIGQYLRNMGSQVAIAMQYGPPLPPPKATKVHTD